MITYSKVLIVPKKISSLRDQKPPTCVERRAGYYRRMQWVLFSPRGMIMMKEENAILDATHII